MRQFMLYWKPTTAEQQWAANEPIKYAASEWFSKVEIRPGDLVWVVSAPEDQLVLLVRLPVAQVLEQGRQPNPETRT